MDISNQSVLLYLIGFPGVGKYTIAQALTPFSYKVVDNHLINNPIFSLLNLDGQEEVPPVAWHYINKIRTTVLSFVVYDYQSNYVLTNVLYNEEGDHKFLKHIEQIATQRESLFVPIILTIQQDEHIKRLTHQERKKYFKLTNVNSIDPEHNPRMHSGLIQLDHVNRLTLDVTLLTPQEAAKAITDHINKIGEISLSKVYQEITLIFTT